MSDVTMDNQQETRLSWLAGLFDGEGCISVRWNRRNHVYSTAISLVVNIYNQDPLIIEEVCKVYDMLGIGYHITNRKDGSVTVVEISNMAGQALLLNALFPRLCGTKKAKAALALRFIRSRAAKKHLGNDAKKYTVEEIGMITAIFDEGKDKRGSSEAIRQAYLA